MTKVQQYLLRTHFLKIYALSRAPKLGDTFSFKDTQLRYELRLTDPYIVTYTRDVDDMQNVSSESLIVDIKGEVLRKSHVLLQGECAVLYDNRGCFVTIYRLKDGQSYFRDDSVTIRLVADIVKERNEGDQLMMLHVPETCNVYRLAQGIEEIV